MEAATLAHSPGSVYIAGVEVPPENLHDEIVRHLLSALRPAVGAAPDSNHALVGHVISALKKYLASHQGRPYMSPTPTGSLPAWKERRIKALMQSELGRNLSLRRLATECGLSVRHFTRCFRLSTGMSPHRYLLKVRLERARQLLLDPALPLHDVAIVCGFSDQSHFTRVFRGTERIGPGAWRRLHLQAPARLGTP